MHVMDLQNLSIDEQIFSITLALDLSRYKATGQFDGVKSESLWSRKFEVAKFHITADNYTISPK